MGSKLICKKQDCALKIVVYKQLQDASYKK
jgi:hypothetical protein